MKHRFIITIHGLTFILTEERPLIFKGDHSCWQLKHLFFFIICAIVEYLPRKSILFNISGCFLPSPKLTFTCYL